MARHKEKQLDKLVKRDYNNDLEEVLAKKSFDEEVKNLLLDILYKIENSYKDYAMVKKNTITKEEYIKKIIKAVKNNCEEIKFIKPGQEKKRTIKVDDKSKKIECNPIETKLLYCLSKIQKCDDIIRIYPPYLNKALTQLINVGNNINTVEPLRDFNGFSWDISIMEIENFYYNLVYQDLVMLCGNSILEEWTNEHDDMIDYLDLLKEDLEKKYGKKYLTEITKLLKVIAIMLGLLENEEFKEEMLKRKRNIEDEINKMQDKVKYLDDLSKRKRKLTNQIRDIDVIISDKEKLSEEYYRRNRYLPLENKIFSKRVLKINLQEQRDELLIELKQCNEMMNARKFIQVEKEYKEELKYLEIACLEDMEKVLYSKIIMLQKRMLQAFNFRIQRAKTKEDLIKIFYELRYFSLIPIENDKNIAQTTKLTKMLEEVKKNAIKKAFELKIMNKVTERNTGLNFQILSYIFESKIIRLEDIFVKLIKDRNDTYVQFYDENTIDKKITLEKTLRKEVLKAKLNKKIKVFI